LNDSSIFKDDTVGKSPSWGCPSVSRNQANFIFINKIKKIGWKTGIQTDLHYTDRTFVVQQESGQCTRLRQLCGFGRFGALL
jgi:hypothetical protein